MVAAMAIDMGNIKATALVFKAIWWLATTSAPNGESNKLLNANSETSLQSAIAIGKPSAVNFFSVLMSGFSIIFSKTFKLRSL